MPAPFWRRTPPPLRSSGALLKGSTRRVLAWFSVSVAVLRTVNSPYYALNRKVESIDQAVSMIGLRQVSTLVTSILLRQSLEGKGMNLVRFWDVSNKRSYAMMTMARRLKAMGSAKYQVDGDPRALRRPHAQHRRRRHHRPCPAAP